MLKFIGIIEILGAIGLIVPHASGILPQLTWLAAVGLSVVMLLAIRLHSNRKETKEMIVNSVFLLLLLFIAYSRFYCELV